MVQYACIFESILGITGERIIVHKLREIAVGGSTECHGACATDLVLAHSQYVSIL